MHTSRNVYTGPVATWPEGRYKLAPNQREPDSVRVGLLVVKEHGTTWMLDCDTLEIKLNKETAVLMFDYVRCADE